MNWSLLKRYIKKNIIGVPALIVIFSLLYCLVKDKLFAYAYLGLWLIELLIGFFTDSKRQLYLADLEKKGLTEKEVDNKAFIARWGENRERGIYKYCIIDGGIVLGALLSLLISFIWMFVVPKGNEGLFSESPGQIFQFIGITYLIGAVIGILVNRIIWDYKQKKFIQLTARQH